MLGWCSLHGVVHVEGALLWRGIGRQGLVGKGWCVELMVRGHERRHGDGVRVVCADQQCVFGRELEGEFECYVRGGGVWRRYGEVVVVSSGEGSSSLQGCPGSSGH